MKGQLKIKTFAAQCVLVAGMMSTANMAMAATSASYAIIDWSSLTWSATDATITFLGGEDYVDAEYWNNGVSMSYSDAGPGSNLVTSVSDGPAYAFGLTDSNVVRSGAFTGNPGEETQGYAGRYEDFEVSVSNVSGFADVTFEVNYVMRAGVGSGIGEAWADVVFELDNLNLGVLLSDVDFVEQIGSGNTGEIFGTFSLTQTFWDGDSGYIYGGATSYAYENNMPAGVPEPGVLPLLGLGLLGLWGASRRRSAS